MGQSNLKLGKRAATVRGLEMLGYTHQPYYSARKHRYERYCDETGVCYCVGRCGALRMYDGLSYLSMTDSSIHKHLQELGRWPNDLSRSEAETVWYNMALAAK